MKIALIYRCFNQDEVERVNLSIETFKKVNINNEYEYFIYGSEEIESEIVVKCSYCNYLRNIDEILNSGYDLVCLSDCNCYFYKSLEDTFEKLLSLENFWQLAGNVPFSYYSVDNGSNYDVVYDGIENISTKFMIINPLEMYNSLMEYFVTMLDDSSDDEDKYKDIDNEVNEFFGNDKTDFYSFQDLLLNSLSLKKIILPEIVFETGYNIKDIENGLVYVLNLNNENGILINNNLIHINDLFEFVKNNEIEISDKYYKLLEDYSFVNISYDLSSKHKMERLEGKIALQEWDIQINTQ